MFSGGLKRKKWEEWVRKTYFIRYIKIYCTIMTVDLDVSLRNQYLTFLEMFYLYSINEHHLPTDDWL